MSATFEIPGLIPTEAERLTPAGERILATASQLFYEYGIRAIGVETIAKQAEVTKKTIFDCFGSKNRLVAAHLRRRDALWRARIRAALAAGPANDPKQILFAPFRALDAWVDEEHPRGCSMINAYAELVDPDDPGRAVILEHKRWLYQLFVAGAEKAGYANPAQLGDELLIVYDGAVVVYAMQLIQTPIATAQTLAEAVINRG